MEIFRSLGLRSRSCYASQRPSRPQRAICGPGHRSARHYDQARRCHFPRLCLPNPDAQKFASPIATSRKPNPHLAFEMAFTFASARTCEDEAEIAFGCLLRRLPELSLAVLLTNSVRAHRRSWPQVVPGIAVAA